MTMRRVDKVRRGTLVMEAQGVRVWMLTPGLRDPGLRKVGFFVMVGVIDQVLNAGNDESGPGDQVGDVKPRS